jgi:hypothetical protein
MRAEKPRDNIIDADNVSRHLDFAALALKEVMSDRVKVRMKSFLSSGPIQEAPAGGRAYSRA